MVAPIYDVVAASSHDLSDIDLAEVATNYAAINFSGGGGGAPAAGIDLAMQGTNCIDRPVSNAERGIVFDNGAGLTGAATQHVFQWLFVATPGLTDSLALRGAYIIIGSATNATMQFHVEGNETYGAAPRVGRCYPIKYTTVASAVAPYATKVGTPAATPSVFGAGLKTTATAKGSNLGVDAIRYGTGAFLKDGELADPCTFIGFSAINDAVANRWGILTNIGGSLELQGNFSIGQESGLPYIPSACYFDDSDQNIVIVDTPHTDSDFTKIQIDDASTICYWTNISIVALGTNNKGIVQCNNDFTVFEINGGTWTDIGITDLRPAVIVNNLTWRRCERVLQDEAVITDCIFDKAAGTEAIISKGTKLSNITGCTFVSSGTGHAVKLGLVRSDTTLIWDNQDTGYAATDGTTGNETISIEYSPTIQTVLTISAAAGASVPTVHNIGTGTVVVSSGLLTIRVTVTDTSGTPIENARVEIRAAETVGTVTTGDLILTGLTNSSGIIEDAGFAYESAFNPSGLSISIKARQGSVSPYKVPSTTSGTIVDVAGFTTIIALQSDE